MGAPYIYDISHLRVNPQNRYHLTLIDNTGVIFILFHLTRDRVNVTTDYKRLRWSRGSVLAFVTQVRGFAPGRSRQIFRAKKSSARLPSEGN